MLERNAITFKPDDTRETVGYLGFGNHRVQEHVYFTDEARGRRLDFSAETGKLLGVTFLDPLRVDVTAMPQDKVVPGERTLVDLLISGGIFPSQIITVAERT